MSSPKQIVPPVIPAFPQWQNHGTVKTKCEVTPFEFKGKRYLLENVNKRYCDGTCHPEYFHEDYFRIRDLKSGIVISHPLLNHYFAQAFVKNDKVYVYAADYGTASEWKCQQIIVTTSENLISWTTPVPAIVAENENLFNSSVTEKDGRYYMIYETDDAHYVPFTAKFAWSDDLIHWTKIPGAVYGDRKYIGGPTLLYQAPWFYLTYVNCVNRPSPNGDQEYYDTRIARSKDLIVWEDPQEDRPVVAPDFTHEIDPLHYPGIFERNASDAEFFQEDGQVRVYWCGGNQLGVADEDQTAVCPGTMKELFESFFAPSAKH